MTGPLAPHAGWAPGDPAYRRITVALFLAGLATFALVYCTQPLLPLLADAFGVSPATSTLSLSVTTITMGVALLVYGPLSDALGRLTLMRATLLVAALIAVASAFAPSWGLLLILRGALGFAVAGLPAVATAYLREEIHSDWGTAGEFNWSSQHLDRGGVQLWRRGTGPRRRAMCPRVRVGNGVRIGRCVRRCVRPGGLSPRGRCSGSSGV